MRALSAHAVRITESATLAISAQAQAMKAAGADIIALTAGEPDFDTPQHIKDAAAAAAAAGFTKYTASSGIAELRRAICDKLHRDNDLHYDPQHITVSNGAKQAIANALAAIVSAGDEVIIISPYWLTYPQLITLCGGTPVVVRTSAADGCIPTARQIRAAISKKTAAIIINSPNNPSGAVYPQGLLADIAQLALAHDLYIISDEIYELLIYNPQTPHHSIAALGSEVFCRTVVINGYSKSHAMTGWRVGYSACADPLAQVIGNIQSHTAGSVNSIAQKAALAAQLNSAADVAAMRTAFGARMRLMCEHIANIPGLQVVQPGGAFYVFADISAHVGKSARGRAIDSAADFAAALLDAHGVAIIPCADFGCANHIRLSYAASDADIVAGCTRLGQFVGSLQ